MANELFGNDAAAVDEAADLPDRIAEEIEKVFSDCAHMTIVTNEIFSGGKNYEGETLIYLRALARLNRILAQRADYVVELVCGLPDVLKG